jgi:hypothetical protein
MDCATFNSHVPIQFSGMLMVCPTTTVVYAIVRAQTAKIGFTTDFDYTATERKGGRSRFGRGVSQWSFYRRERHANTWNSALIPKPN